MAKGHFSLLLYVCFALMPGCQTTGDDSLNSSLPQPVIKNTTILPSAEALSIPLLVGKALVPQNIVNLTEVTRPRVEVREGPGVHFPLIDTLLVAGTRVLAFGRVGVWQKVYLPDRHLQGWVHYQTLGKTKKSDNLLEVELSQLPKVFATRPVHKGFSAKDMKKVGVDFPRGTVFTALKETDRMVLVLLDETQSVLWLAKKDAQ